MTSFTYFDQVSGISISDGVVKVELAVGRQASADQESVLTLEPSIALATSLNGFLRLHEQMTRVVDGLVERGVLQKRETATDVDA